MGLQEQKGVPASGELSPELQDWSPYSPAHSSRHSNPPLYPNRPSVGEPVASGREEAWCGPGGWPSWNRGALDILGAEVPKSHLGWWCYISVFP